ERTRRASGRCGREKWTPAGFRKGNLGNACERGAPEFRDFTRERVSAPNLPKAKRQRTSTVLIMCSSPASPPSFLSSKHGRAINPGTSFTERHHGILIR